MSAADKRYAEKIAARASGRAPVFQHQPVAASATASPHERYLAKIAARAAAAKGQGAPSAPEAKVEPKAETPQAKPEENKPTEARFEPKVDNKPKK